MVVRNRCPETGNEEYLVARDVFAARYRRGTAARPAADGYEEYVPLGLAVRFFVVAPEDGAFSFTAPWGETMVARPGDAIVQDPGTPAAFYRVARLSFACTYEVEG
jgi:hypothetical protein